ncbi:MAG: hypothetical protein N2643_05545 [Endomicrobia bacterium]|nr:hypothetical protein [Endomicrobiia bacterium]
MKNLLKIIFFIRTINSLYSIELSTYQLNLVSKYTYNFKKNTIINPNFEIFDVSEYKIDAYLNLILDAKITNFITFSLKIRPQYTKEEITLEEKKVLFDNAYIDFCIKDTNFISLGIINIIDSIGLSYTPTDFFIENTKTDYHKKEEERKTDREGDYVIRFEKLFEKISISLAYAPYIYTIQQKHQKFRTKLSLSLENFDISFLFFYSSYSAYGLNFSSILADNIEVHLDIGYFEKNKRDYIDVKQVIYNDVYLYNLKELKNKKNVQGLVGSNFTAFNGINFLVEYFRNEDGYTSDEWNSFIETVEMEGDKYIDPAYTLFKNILRYNFFTFNSLMTYRFLRQNYLFCKTWKDKIFNLSDLSLNFLINLDDRSFVFLPELSIKLKNWFKFFIGCNMFSGEGNTEFRLVPYRISWFLEVRVFI